MSVTPDFIDNFRNQKILVVEPFFYTPHVETGMEISETLAANNEITYIGPDALNSVTDETYKVTSRLLIKLSRKRNVSAFLSDAVKKMTRGEVTDLIAKFDPVDLSMIIFSGDVENAMFEDFDVGMGIRSSLLSLTRDTSVALSDHKDYALALAHDAVKHYQLTKDLIRAHRFDSVLLFNGRLAPVRAIRRACETSGVRYLVHERGSSIGKYAIYDGATPHQPAPYRNWADAWWRASDDPDRDAHNYLGKRRHGVATSWYAFNRKQRPGALPPKTGRKRITFFTSSEDELAAIGDELKADTPFCDQITAIRSLGEACREKGYEFIIRFHPNTSSTETALLQAAGEIGEVVCAPSSPVDSYALVDSSDIVFTQNSSIGIEAASTGKSVFYMGRNLFEHCRSVRRIKTDIDLSESLKIFGDNDPQDALKYANFLGNHGIDYRYYKPHGIISGTYRGKDLNAPLAKLRELKLHLTRGGP